jgi:methylenetetrahydrofolate dehydrogenase (NADP+)/methenyltetrahydrofolate cyclohydrolase
MIDCKKYADEILDSITGSGHLAVISVGNDPASRSYIKGKKHDCDRVGFGFENFWFPEEAEQNDIIQLIEELNVDEEVTGIIVQLPLPPRLDADVICRAIAPEKDVDGFRPDSPFKPCTPEGIVYLLKKELGELTGKHAVIIGRGKLVGRPLAKMLLDEDMTVTVCHSKSSAIDIYNLSNNSDAIIVAAGVPEHFYFSMIPDTTVVVDCGVHRKKDGKLCGDVLYVDTGRVTPVPGGVGLLTRAMLMKHVERKRTDENTEKA